ncbi:hypothetical protein BU26DRAFT_556459 [Trematosphaeria pertusa]|uniref:Uncharacterized protein n=1 Tax=Trematosphaeria pertusa TaxID=390896 RepID=A0A6A6HUA8_9PLEO|nr:uncharacterized protein BU26DRAFT_556459 [Trematosphaeria pertusa]KAF2241010.1 hypothetical protein BU26DRAFT_556459 [Trematosphaeria pertusa]
MSRLIPRSPVSQVRVSLRYLLLHPCYRNIQKGVEKLSLDGLVAAESAERVLRTLFTAYLGTQAPLLLKQALTLPATVERSAKLRLRAGAISDYHNDHLNTYSGPFWPWEESYLGFSGSGQWPTDTYSLFNWDDISLSPGTLESNPDSAAFGPSDAFGISLCSGGQGSESGSAALGPSPLDVSLFDFEDLPVGSNDLSVGFEDSSIRPIDANLLDPFSNLQPSPQRWDMSRPAPTPTLEPFTLLSRETTAEAMSRLALPLASMPHRSIEGPSSEVSSDLSSRARSTEDSHSDVAPDPSCRTLPRPIERAVLRFACKVPSCSARFLQRRQLE